MGSMMSSLSVFSGAGTILGPLISMAGPGIMVTVMSMIASVVMSTVLTPLFSQFNTTIFSNDLDTLMAPLGGTTTGALAILDNIAALTSVTSNSGVSSQDSGSGYIAQSTGSSVGTTGTSNPLSSLGSSGTCNVTAIGTCLANIFNDSLLLSQTLLDNSNGVFSPFLTVVGELLTAMETLAGSSSTPATSSAAPAKAISTSASLATTTTTTPSTSWFAMELGGLSIVKDLLGYIKIGESGDKNAVLGDQFIRFVLDALQFPLSIYYRHEYPSNSSSYLWFVKSGVSLVTNSIALLNDWNTVSPQGWLNDLGVAMGLSNFNEASQELKIITQSMGALFYGLYFLKQSSSLSISTVLFMGVYIVQKFLKIAIFILKGAGIENSLEKNLYAVSAGINVVQMILSILGIS